MNRAGVTLVLLSLLAGFGDLSETKAATLSITAEHGSVVLEPPGGSYAAGTEVHIIPRPDTGYCFDHWSGDISGNRLVPEITMDADKSVTANFKTWNAPMGIPIPSFGITETYRMYDNPANRNPSLTYHASAGGGYYTHYVDNTAPAATDTGNPYGTAAVPRLTTPSTLPPGSVLEIHGGPYATDPQWDGEGTSTLPIFIRGVGWPQFTVKATVGYYGSRDASYMVLEGLYARGISVSCMTETHHVAVRHCEIEGTLTMAHTAGIGVGIPSGRNPNGASIHDIVVCGNEVHTIGDWQASGDPDGHGMAVTAEGALDSAYNVWILDNLFHHNSGNGVQVNAANLAYIATIHHIYLGRNTGYENKQDLLWTKHAEDVIFAQNSAWRHLPSDSSLGGGLGWQYGPNRVWFLFNDVSECSIGIRCSTDEGGGGLGPGLDTYLIGNLIHNIHRPQGATDTTSVWKKGCAIFIASESSERNIFCNTIYDTDSGIQIARRAELHIHNNIFANVAEEHVFFEFADSLEEGESDMAYNVFDVPARIIWGRSGDQTTYTLTTFNAAHPGRANGSMEADPLFVDAANGNFRLQPTSPAIDIGISSSLQQACDRFSQLYGLDIRKDVAGGIRPQGNSWDLGAYEYFLSPIVNLAVSGTSQNSLTLTWTVPAEQGITGTPTGYDIRYAGSSITEANWGAATQVQGEPIAGAFGQQQSFTITGLNLGAMYHVALQVLDQGGHASAMSNVVSATTATTGNHAPVLMPVGDRSVIEMETLTFSISATDADDDPLAYSATNLPAGATFTAATRTFTWTPTSLQRGRGRVTFQVSDAQITVSETITITVQRISNQAPVLAAVGDKSTNENTSLGFTLSATDADGDPLAFSATSLPGGATLVNGAFQWTPNYDQAGSYPVTLTVSDGDLTDSEQITIMVGNATDQTAPSAHDFWPAADAFQVPPNTLIAMTISDDGLGVDASSVAIRINNQLVYAGNSGLYQSASGDCRRMGTPAGYRYYFQPARPFDFDQHVSVTITGSDIAHNAMTPMSYQFATEMRSFGRNQPVSADGDISGRPVLATDSQGNLWATWHAGPANARDIYAARRDSQPRQWNTPLRLTSVASDRCNSVLAIGPDNVLYLAWQDNRRGNWDIYASASADGATWGDPVRVTDSNDNQVNPVIAIDQATPYRVYIAWERGNPGSRDIYLASCSSSLVSKTMAQVTSDPADQMEPALAVGSDNTVYLLWTDQRNGSADIYGSSSAASSWSNMAVVTGPGNQSHPAVAAAPGTSTLHVVWQSDAAGSLDVLYGTSTGLPASPFLGSSLIDDTTGADQTAPSIVAARDYAHSVHVYACWQDNRAVSGTQDSDLYVAEIRSGTSGTNILVGDDETNSNQSDPALGYDEYGQPAVVWTDSRRSVPRIYSACSTYFKPVALASALIARAAGGRVGVDPAAINGAGDVSIQIPVGACDSDVAITISEIQNLPSFATSSVAGYEIGPSGVQFSLPATVTIPYAGSGTGQTAPYWYDALTATLSQQGMTEITHRTLANGIPVVSFKTTHLTTFYILESPIAAGSSGGGGCALSRAPGGDIAGSIFPYVALALLLLATKWRPETSTRMLKSHLFLL